MNKSIQVVFKDKLDNQILDKDFFSLLFNRIVNLPIKNNSKHTK